MSEPAATAAAPDAPDAPVAVALGTGPSGTDRPLWQRLLWGAAGMASLVTGIVGIFLPLLPTTPFVLLAAFCFTRSSTRCERWLLGHPRFGPMVRQWRARRAIPRRVKQLAWAMMAVSSVLAAVLLPARVGWIPAACCTAVALWMWRLPDA